ncbi:MAG: phenylacetate--CoA ligase family protein [Burkholderiales bacterium]|nr:phenylacetate--CoA ligase family protein [Burkholderiales bacterium]
MVRSGLPGVIWPAVTAPDTALALALQYQLERSQWLPPAALHELQQRQLDAVLRHAWETVPFYRWHWHTRAGPGAAPLRDRFAGLPLLHRADLERGFDALKSGACPASHGPVVEGSTAGTTGKPVRTLRTGYAALWWRVIALRDHLWHARDFDGNLAAIAPGAVAGESAGWGPATAMLDAGGRSAARDLSGAPETWLEWLAARQPDYLLAPPSVVAGLARCTLAHRTGLPRLKEARTFGERLGPDVRRLAREAWSAPVTDTYSCDEAGFLALQCPAHEHYHVQSESVLLEVLDEQGNACPPGSVGRVVVTTLQNFAMPLVRYDTGDWAEAGGRCPCGRGLPVLKRIAGRTRNAIVTAPGGRVWPEVSPRGLSQVAPVLQCQLVQTQLDLIEARVVAAGTLTPAQTAGLHAILRSGLPAGVRLEIVTMAALARGAGGRFEDVVSALAPPRP